MSLLTLLHCGPKQTFSRTACRILWQVFHNFMPVITSLNYFYFRHSCIFPPISLVKLVQLWVYISRILGALTKKIKFYDISWQEQRLCRFATNLVLKLPHYAQRSKHRLPIFVTKSVTQSPDTEPIDWDVIIKSIRVFSEFLNPYIYNIYEGYKIHKLNNSFESYRYFK